MVDNPSPAELKRAIRIAAIRRTKYVAKVQQMEAILRKSVALVIGHHEGGVRGWSRENKFSAGYACDLRHEKRRISGTVLERILQEKQNGTEA